MIASLLIDRLKFNRLHFISFCILTQRCQSERSFYSLFGFTTLLFCTNRSLSQSDRLRRLIYHIFGVGKGGKKRIIVPAAQVGCPRISLGMTRRLPLLVSHQSGFLKIKGNLGTIVINEKNIEKVALLNN